MQATGYFREKEFGNFFEYTTGAPTPWAADRGATHTMYPNTSPDSHFSHRPARILKTVAYIGVDENEFGDIIWEKWSIRILEVAQ